MVHPQKAIAAAEPALLAGGKGGHSETPRRIRGVLLIVALVGVLIQGIQVLACRPILLPDSRQYVLLATRILEHGDFGHELFQFRPPGYPLILAGIFSVFGSASGPAIMVLQHGMIVAIAILAALLGWYLTERRVIALLAGVFAAGALHVSGMANAILTETPYTLALTVCVTLLVRGIRRQSVGSIALASLAAGIATVVKPTGQVMVIVCVVVALYIAWRKYLRSPRSSFRRCAVGISGFAAASIVPAAAVMLPVALNSLRHFDRFQMTGTSGYCLYFRTAFVDDLDDPQSESLTALKLALEVAKRRGTMRSDATHHDFYLTLLAYQQVHQATLSETFELMGQAGTDMALKHWPGIARRTITHSYRTFFEPDYTYRILPGGAPDRAGYMAFDADVMSHTTFHEMAEQLVGTDVLSRYLPEAESPLPLTGLWSRLVGWYHRRIELGPPVVGILDTPYEEMTALALIGGVLALFRRHRAAWLLCAGVVAIHVVLSAALQGTLGRYTLPVHPVLNVLQALTIVALVDGVRWLARRSVLRASHRPPVATVQRNAT